MKNDLLSRGTWFALGCLALLFMFCLCLGVGAVPSGRRGGHKVRVSTSHNKEPHGKISARFGMRRATTSYRLPTPRFSWKSNPLGAAAQGVKPVLARPVPDPSGSSLQDPEGRDDRPGGGVRMFEIQIGRNPNLRGGPPVQQASAGKKQHGGKGK